LVFWLHWRNISEQGVGLKIAFDSWVLASRFRYQGTYVYAQSLLTEFRKIAQASSEISFCLFTSPRNSNDAGMIASGKNFQLAEAPLLSNDRLWRLGGASFAARRASADLIFAPTVSVLPLARVPLVCTIHDVTPVVMPSHSMKVTLFQRSLLWSTTRMARQIITDSECSRKDLIRLYGLPESKVSVVYLGYDKAIFNDVKPDPEDQKKLLSRLALDKPYILHHGMIQPRKNLKRLIEAYRLMLSRNLNLEFDLVLAGALGWEYQDILAAANSPGKGRIIFPGTLSGDELAMLVKGAGLVVTPSLYEGFCLPMIEAMACGVPVIASNASCLPEISGGMLKYFDPCSVEEMTHCMEQALEDDGLRKTLAREGKKRAAFFDWQRCAQETLAILKKCGSPN
jgi:glycosyltransferase involved in cell wall biosynthesis